MADKKIGIRIELNGFKGVVSNIEQLRKEIQMAEQDLDQLDFGSALYEELRQQLIRTKTVMEDIKKSQEGIGIEKRLEGMGKLAGGITSAFAAASAAMSLLGSDTEQMSEVQIQAQNAITLALSARSIAEIGVGVNIVKTTIATQAEAMAAKFAAKETNILNTSLSTMFKTIAANPIGAMVTVLGLAITAFMTFRSSADDAAESQKDFNDEINKTAGQGIGQMKNLVNTINNTSLSLETRKKAIDDLQKDFPAYFENLNKEDILNGKVKISTDKLTDAIIAQAKARALEGRIEERYTKLLELEDALAEAKRNTLNAQKAVDAYEDGKTGFRTGGGGIMSAQVTSTGGEESLAINKLNRLKKEQNEIDKERNKILKEQEKDEKRVQDLMEETTDVIGTGNSGNTGAKNENVKATQAQLDAYDKLKKSLDLVIDGYDKEKERLEKLLESKSVDVPDAKIVEQLKEVSKARQEILKTQENFAMMMSNTYDVFLVGDGRVIDSLASLESSVEYSDEMIGEVYDRFGRFYRDFQKEITEAFNAGQYEKMAGLIKDALNSIAIGSMSGDLETKYVEPVTKVIEQYEKFAEFGQKQPTFEKIFGGTEEANKALKDLQDNIKLVMEIQGKFGEVSGEVGVKVMSGAIKYSELLKKEEEFSKKYYDGLVANLDEFRKQQIQSIKDEEAVLAKKGLLTKEQQAEFEKSIKETEGLSEEALKNLAKLQTEGFMTMLKTQIENESIIFKTNNQIKNNIDDAVRSNEDTQVLYINAMMEHLDSFTEWVYNNTKTNFSKMKNEEEQFAALQTLLQAQGIDTTKLTYKQKLSILQSFLKKEEDMISESEVRKQQAIQKTIEALDFALNELTKSMSQISSIAAQRFTLQMDVLTKEYQDDMADITENTKEANDKRIELEQIYQAQKKEIEKKAQITALKFQMAQAIASGAQAILNIWAAHAANPILAGVLTAVAVGITAYQADTINRQLQLVQSMRRGGILMGGGGIASGASHEQGGIYAGGGTFIEGNEAVINRNSTLQYSGLLSQINQSGGGRPLMVQSAMDSRLIEALAKQKQEPIRAFVIEQDITRAQSVNKRLEQLASF